MGIVGSTVMPHNLYLHSNIVKNRSNRSIQQWGQIKVNTSSQQAPPSLSEDEVSRSLTSSTDSAFLETQQDESRHSLNTTEINNFWNSDTMKHMIELTSFDSTIALSFALFINSAILIVSAAAFYDGDGSSVSDLTEAYRLLVENIGPFAGYAFAIALLFAGQSSTITGTLAGQICMEGKLFYDYMFKFRILGSNNEDIACTSKAIDTIISYYPCSIDCII